MIGKLFFLAVMAGVAVSAASDQPSSRSFVGYAYDSKTDELVYSEVHSETLRKTGGIVLTTSYRDVDGNTIVERTVDFSADDLAPSFETEDIRTGYVEGLRYEESTIVAYRRRPSKNAIDERTFDDPVVLVADAGFDRFVSSNWDRLTSGEKLEASFLVPSRLRSLPFDVEKTGEGRLDGEPVVSFKMSFRNALVRLFVGSVQVTYHRDHRVLLRYEGLSNIRDAGGDNHDVRIDFPLDERSEWLSDELRRVANNGLE
jgi:hypothetical protein